MRIIEEAYDLFQKAYDLYSLFWGLNLKLISAGGVKHIDEGAINKADTEKKAWVESLAN